MSCISSNFSSFFLNSLNDPSEFSKYLSNGELKCSNFEDFQVFSGCGSASATVQQQQQQTVNGNTAGGGESIGVAAVGGGGIYETACSNNAYTNAAATTTHYAGPGHTQAQQQTVTPQGNYVHHQHQQPAASSVSAAATSSPAAASGYLPQHTTSNRWPTAIATPNGGSATVTNSSSVGAQHFDGSFEFIKYLRHSSDFTPNGANGNGTPSGAAASSTDANCDRSQTPNGNQNLSSSLHHPQHPQHHHNHHHPQHHSPASPGAGAGVGGTPTSASSNSASSAAAASILDLDSSTSQKPRSASRKVAALLSSVSRNASNSLSLDSAALDVFDHDSKQTIFDLQHLTNGSNSNESSLELSSLAFPNSHLNASNSNTSSEGAAGSSAEFALLGNAANNSGAPKPLTIFAIKENFDVHPSHKVEEGIFQHMNKLPSKKKETLKQLGVRFTGQMTLTDKSIVVDNFVKFCEEYDIKDHRPFLSLNQSGLNKPEQIKFARYLGQGLPTFTLFCIYSNFKNLFCTKRTEIYTKEGYNLPYILDKTKRYLANTTADLKNMAANDGLEIGPTQQQLNNNLTNLSNNNTNNNNNTSFNHGTNLATMTSSASGITGAGALSQQQQQPQQQLILPTLPPMMSSTPTATPLPMDVAKYCIMPRTLENLVIYENFDVHETHRIEDGVCTHLTRLPPKKQELLKQFGIQNSSQQSLSYYEKYIIIENFNKFCNEYQISDHRPFLDFHESGLPKCEQLKFVRYLGQGLPNLTLNKIYVGFKDLLGMSRMDKLNLDGYNLEALLKKKRKNLYNRLQNATAPM